MRVLQGSEAAQREMAVPVQTGRIRPEPLPAELPTLYPYDLVETADEEAVLMTIVWIILAILFIAWIIKTS